MFGVYKDLLYQFTFSSKYFTVFSDTFDEPTSNGANFRTVHSSGDSLVFIFPLATMLTFTSAVGKLNVRVLWHHHMLLQVIS